MHDAGHPTTGRRLEGEDGSAAALGDEVVLQVLGERRIAGDLAQPLGQLAAALAQLAAQAAQHGRSRVLQVGAVLLDRTADLLGDREQARRRCRLSAPAARGGRRAPSARGVRPHRPGSSARRARGSWCRACCLAPRARPHRLRRRRHRDRARPHRRAGRPPRSSAADAGVPRRRRPTAAGPRRGARPARSRPPRPAGPARPAAPAVRGRARA